jgi:hypothetical protein
MRKAAVMFLTVLLMAGSAFAERKELPPQAKGHGNDDHDDNSPIATGFAVVTPSGGAASGLVVFETFGIRGIGANGDASQAGVLAPDLTTSAMLFVDSSGRLSKNLGVAIVNPNSSALTVSVTLKKSDGTQLVTGNVTIPSHQQVSKYAADFFSSPSSIPSDFTGTLIVTSTGASPLPFSMIGLRFRGVNFSTVPATSLTNITTALPTIATGVGGAGAILLPQFATGGGWATEVVIANTASSSVTVRLDLFKPDGTALTATLNGDSASSFTNLTIPAGGVLTLAPRDSNGDDDF